MSASRKRLAPMPWRTQARDAWVTLGLRLKLWWLGRMLRHRPAIKKSRLTGG